MEQFQVIKHITLILGRMLEESVREATGKKVRVLYAYEDGLRKKSALTVIQYALTSRSGQRDREYEFAGGGERFRNPPLLFQAHYIVSAWATPPDDQELLGAVLRTFLDRAWLEPEAGDEEMITAYAGVPSIDIKPLSLEEHRTLCDAYGMPLAPSMRYLVDFRLQSGKVTPIKRVKERVIDYRKIEG